MKKFFLTLTLITLSSISAFACSCIEENISLKKKVEKAYTTSDVIFTGKVISIKDNKDSSLLEVVFDVTNVVKGITNKKTISIFTENSSAACGYSFNPGRNYLVYSYTSEYKRKYNSLENEKVSPFNATGICTRTSLLESVKNCELRKLKKIAKKNKN